MLVTALPRWTPRLPFRSPAHSPCNCTSTRYRVASQRAHTPRCSSIAPDGPAHGTWGIFIRRFGEFTSGAHAS